MEAELTSSAMTDVVSGAFADSSPSVDMQQRNANRCKASLNGVGMKPSSFRTANTSASPQNHHQRQQQQPPAGNAATSNDLFDMPCSSSPSATDKSPQMHQSLLGSTPIADPAARMQGSAGSDAPEHTTSILRKATTPQGTAHSEGQGQIDYSDSLQSLGAYPSYEEDVNCSPGPLFKREDLLVSASLGEQDTPPSGDPATNDGGDASADKRQSSRFVYKLMRMVSDPESQHLISFNPSGTSVVVTNFDDFAKEVLPKHFKHSNFSSFIRQLNMYGFYKVNKTPRGKRHSNDSQIWEFSHPKFLRGRTDLLEEIRRKALDTEHARVEARDLRFNVSFGQYQIRQHLEEMQWRLDQTMEQNIQLRELSQNLQDTLINVLEFLKTSNGGQLPFDVHLPRIDLSVGPSVPPSPFAPGAAWSAAPSQIPMPQQPTMPAQRQQFSQQQPERPSIYVTEPHNQGVINAMPPHSQGSMGNMRPPLSPSDASGPFSMAGLGHVSPFGSRRVSATSSTGLGERSNLSSIQPDYFQCEPILERGGSGGQTGLAHIDACSASSQHGIMQRGQTLGAQTSQTSPLHGREVIANLPKRSMSARDGLMVALNVQTGTMTNDGQQQGDGMALAHHMEAMPGSINSGLGVMPSQNQSMPASPLFLDQLSAANAQQHQLHHRHQQQQQQRKQQQEQKEQQYQSQQQQQHLNHLHAAVNTPLPPSPAISGYPGQGQGFAGPNAFAQNAGVFPGMLSAPSFDHRHGGHLSSPASPISPVDGQFGLFAAAHADKSGLAGFDVGEDGDLAVDGSLLGGSGQDSRQSKTMRTSLKRTASGHSGGLMASGAGDTSTFVTGPNSGPGSAGKRKSPN